MGNNSAPEIRFAGFTDAWEQRKLGELLEYNIITEQSDGNHGELYPKSSEFTNKGIPYLSASNINNNDIDYQDIKYLPLERARKFKKGVAQDGDILLAHNATVGPSVLLKTDYPFVILSTTLTLYRVNKNQMDNHFFLNAIRSGMIQNQLKIMMKQTTRNQVPILAQRTMNIAYPKSLQEQTQIGTFLAELDHLITLHQRKLNNIKSLKAGLLQKMFPKKGEDFPEIRFPGFTDAWEQRKAKDLFNPIAEKGHDKLPVLSVTQEFGVVYREEVGIDIKYDPSTLKDYKVIHPGDFVISLRSFQGGFELSDKLGITSPAYTIFKPKETKEQDNLFWKTQFKTFKFIESLKTITFGIRDGKSISFSEFGDLRLQFPSNKDEQVKIGQFFSSLDNLNVLHQRELNALKETKKAFLQKMFV
ncbi:restriction endonuclease subunit S [Paenibacillus illinoisensis]|uniref:restriction endonuclease subunit S n=1 Tax=Paenibacillus illinoisensis TaxID=59845 RepID=UPI003D282D58